MTVRAGYMNSAEDTPASDTGRRAIVIAGMHRGGTSALTGILHHLGAAMPRNLIPKSRHNPRGFFESEVLYPKHDALLADAGTSWNQLLGPSPEWFATPAAERWVGRLAEITESEFGDDPLIAIKDPRLSRFVPIWQRVLARLDIEVHYLIPVRSPLAVARSLKVATDIPEASGQLLWLDHFLRAEHDTRGLPRAFVSYENLVADWRSEIARAVDAAGIPLPSPDRVTEAAIDEFLVTDKDQEPLETIAAQADLHPWVASALGWAAAATSGESPPSQTLDELRANLRTAEAAFGAAIGATEHRVASEFQRVEQLGDEVSQLTLDISHLKGDLEAQRTRKRELQASLSRRRDETHSLRKTTSLLMRWVLDRVREPGEHAPPELRAALAAIEKAEPAAIPEIASTALLLAEKNIQIATLENERASRASVVVASGQAVAKLEASLSTLRKLKSDQAGAVRSLQGQVDALRTSLARAEDAALTSRIQAAEALGEAERLADEIAQQLEDDNKGILARVWRAIDLR